MFLSQAGGACDCGDTSVMKEDGLVISVILSLIILFVKELKTYLYLQNSLYINISSIYDI